MGRICRHVENQRHSSAVPTYHQAKSPCRCILCTREKPSLSPKEAVYAENANPLKSLLSQTDPSVDFCAPARDLLGRPQ